MLTAIEKGCKNQNDGVASLESVPIQLKYICLVLNA